MPNIRKGAEARPRKGTGIFICCQHPWHINACFAMDTLLGRLPSTPQRSGDTESLRRSVVHNPRIRDRRAWRPPSPRRRQRVQGYALRFGMLAVAPWARGGIEEIVAAMAFDQRRLV